MAFYEKPILKFDRLIETYLAFAPDGFKSFRSAIPVWVKEKLFQERELKRGLGGQFKRRIVYAMHHNSHAASAFFPSPFEEAAILTMDGVGEWATATLRCRSRQQVSRSRTNRSSRIRSVCCTRRSRTTAGSRSTRGNTSSWGWRPTASRATSIASSARWWKSRTTVPSGWTCRTSIIARASP